MNQETPSEPKIYLLPNLMTAGNLACGFCAVLCIFYGIINGTTNGGSYHLSQETIDYYQYAIILIFGSCIFDMLDGRLARLVGKDSPFGREFDSLADVVSFGLAPALLLAKAVLFEMPHPGIGWGIGFLYLLCGALRLARFNCIAAMPGKPASTDFVGLPIPMAAGAIVSVVFLIIRVYNSTEGMGFWKYPLALAMAGLALLMMSKVPYPSFKHVNFRTRATMPVLVLFIIAIAFIVMFPWVMPAVLFGLYLLYGLIRPWLGRRLQKHLEAESVVENDDES